MKYNLLSLLLILAFNISFGQNISFKQIPAPPPAPQNITSFTGAYYGATTSADVNNDGYLDLFITGKNSAGGKIALLYINDVYGNLTQVFSTPFIGVYNSAIATADIDGDGDVDVLISGKNSSNQRITKLYTNNGSGVFTLNPTTVFEGLEEGTIDFCDVDGDADQDVLITGINSSGQQKSNLYTNNGSGTFTLVSGTPFTGVKTGAVAFVDIDNDLDQDVLITGYKSYNHSVSHLYKNNGSGIFTASSASTIDSVFNSSIAFADIDNDGDMDLLLAGNTTYQNYVTQLYSNNGSGIFTKVIGTSFLGISYGDVAFIDIDNDNDQDIFITGDLSNKVAKLYSNNGSGVYTATAGDPFVGVGGSSVAVGDFDNDNDQDIFLMGDGGFNKKFSNLYVNNGTGTFALATGTPFEELYYGKIAYADVDNDGDQDVFIGGMHLNSTYQSKLYINNGNGSYQIDTLNIFDSISCFSVAFADIDGDSDMDLIYSGKNNSYARVTKLLINNGSGVFSLVSSTPFSAMACSSIAFADIDGDTDLDLLLCGENSTAITNTLLYSNNGSGVFTLITNTSLINVDESAVAFADIDGDNDQDLLITGHNNNYPNVYSKLYTNNGTGTFTLVSGNPFYNAKNGAVAFVDIDGDNDQDVLISGEHGSGLKLSRLYTNNGSGVFSYVPYTPFENVYKSSISIADIDNDNDMDILISGTSSTYHATTKLYINNGSGSFSYQLGMPFDSLFNGSIVFLDINNDNYKDIIIAGSNWQEHYCAKLYKNESNNTYSTDIQVACDSFTWTNGLTYYASNSTATDTLVNSIGGDSIITLNLTINNPTVNTEVVIACDSFIWIDGLTYTSNNNTAIDTLSSIWGCDSILLLDLTIYPSSLSTDTVIACDSFTWINGLTYTSNNNTATDTLSSIWGCDSILLLDLTIYPSSLSIDTVIACDSFTWIDGLTYTSNNNTAIDTLSSIWGCDSIVSLNLTIDTVDVSLSVNEPSITSNAVNATYQWLDCNANYAIISNATSQTYTAVQNGQYAVEIIQNSCTDTSNCVAINHIAIGENSIFNNIQIYPNPTTGKVLINLGNLKEADVFLYNNYGQLLLTKRLLKAKDTNLNINKPPGIYLLVLRALNQSYYYKIVLQ